jgi:hypothetical protein
MSYQNAVPAAAGGPEIVLRRLRSLLYSAVMLAVFLPLYLWIPGTYGTLKGAAGGAVIGALISGSMVARFRYQISAGQLTATQLWSKRESVDLTQLTSVTAPNRPISFWRSSAYSARGWLELRDARGGVARLNFFGTPRAQRQRLLAALGPYVLADGVSRNGLVTQALAGDLWWPRPRR